MPSVAPARKDFVVEAISGLQRLQREIDRVSQRDENYESKKRALQAEIQELRKMISADSSTQPCAVLPARRVQWKTGARDARQRLLGS